jgi:hypothetical protein
MFWLDSGSDYTGGTAPTAWETRDQTDRNAAGTLSLGDSTSNDWYITGVQLEAGTTASDFEFLPVDVNLDRCYRYYELIVEGDNQEMFNAYYFNSSNARAVYNSNKIMRATPSIDIVTGTNFYEFLRDNVTDAFDGFTLGTLNTNKNQAFIASGTLSGTSGQAGWFRTADATCFVALDAEL